MRTVSVQLESIAAYSQSRMLQEKKKKDESWDDFERRIWREKAHVDSEGRVFIPSFAFKQAIDSASKYLGKIEGKGNATWTKHFVGGIVVSESVTLPDKKDKLDSVWIMANSNGKRGPGTRVPRCFPIIPKWSGTIQCIILAEEITQEVFAQAMQLAGMMIGIGRFRPENGGSNGRFKVTGIKWA
jgi:hypothetical protein